METVGVVDLLGFRSGSQLITVFLVSSQLGAATRCA